MQWPMIGVKAANLEPPRLNQNEHLIRLNNNENAYGPSAKVADAIKSSLENVNRYSRMEYGLLSQRIASFHDVKPEQVLLGCGSTEIFRVAAFAFLGKGKRLIQASPTFDAMEHYARATGSEVISLYLTPSFSHDLDAMLAGATASSALVYICNPNNPTASLTPHKDLETFLGKLPASTVIVIDEAYHHYAGHSEMYASFIDRPLHDERVVVTRTFSKVYGLAGLRLGYAVASPKVIQQMQKFVTEDNVNSMITQAAMVALSDRDGVKEFVRRNADDRQEFFNQALRRMLKPIDSHANFVMMNTFHPSAEVIEHFSKNNILIAQPFPRMNTYIRVSLGLPEEMLAFWRTWDALPFTKNFTSH